MSAVAAFLRLLRLAMNVRIDEKGGVPPVFSRIPQNP